MSNGNSCTAVSDSGVPCAKPLYRARNGELWDHAGGHIFATAETLERLDSWHYDAGLLLAGTPAPAHRPEDCPGTDECPVVKFELV